MPRQAIGTEIVVNGNSAFGFNGGLALFVVAGVFDSATAKIQLRDHIGGVGGIPGPWINVVDAAFTSDGYVGLQVQAGVEYRLNVAGGGGSLNITAALYTE